MPLADEEFVLIENFPELVRELQSLAGIKIVDGEIYFWNGALHVRGRIRKKQPLCEFIELVIEHHNSGQIELRQYGLCRLAIIVSDLRLLKTASALLGFFRKRLKGSSGNEYWGWRFELDIATTLLKAGVAFQKGELLPGGDEVNGDFVIEDVRIECASVHADKLQFNSFLHKICSIANRKAKSSYASRKTALFIDVTNLFQVRLELGIPLSDHELRRTARELLSTVGFGAIVYSSWLVNKDVEPFRYQNLFTREDASDIDEALSNFLTNRIGLGQQLPPIRKFKPIGCS